MKETNNDHMREDDCSCHGMHGGWHKHFLLKIILILVILGIVFSVGVKVGEFKAMFLGGYGGEMRFGKHMFLNGQPWGADFMMRVSTSTPR